MIVTISMRAIKENVKSGTWKLEPLNDGFDTQKIVMADETEWLCWFDPTDIVVLIMEEFISSVETAMTGGKKNYY
jgi:hypothetical protein